jgi:hypothetical protein
MWIADLSSPQYGADWKSLMELQQQLGGFKG